MNYAPYYYPVVQQTPSLFSGLLRGINFRSIISGTQKTLNFANQAIPLIKQAGPMFKNAKTMFQVVNEFRKTNIPKTNNKKQINNQSIKPTTQNKVSEPETIQTNNQGPTFFV